MYTMSISDTLLVAKVFAYVMGDNSITLTDADKDAAKSLIKRIADQKYEWSLDQREQFKMFVDVFMR